MPPQGELARADLVHGCPIGVAHKGALAPAGRRPHHSTRYSSARGPHSESTAPPLQGDRVQFHPSIGAIGGTLRPGVGQKEVTCGFIRWSLRPAQSAARKPLLLGWNRIRLIPKRSSIHIDAWIAGWSKPGQFVHGRVDCRERASAGGRTHWRPARLIDGRAKQSGS